MLITANVNLCTLRQPAPPAVVGEALQFLRDCAVETEPDDMSTTLVGDDTSIFSALQEAFCQIAERGQAVMVVTLSSACPASDELKERVSL